MTKTRVEGTSLGAKGPGTAFFTGGRLLEIGDDRMGVVRRQVGKRLPGHDRGELAALRSGPGRNCSNDLIVGPFAQACPIVGGQVRAGEHAKPGDCETDLRAAERARKIGLAEKSARRVAVVAAADRDQIFAARDLVFVGQRCGGPTKDGYHRKERDQSCSHLARALK